MAPQQPLGQHTQSASTPNPGSQFAPRREFIREEHTFSTFALFALSGSSSIRLYSFPPSVISALRQFFHNSKTGITQREDTSQTLCEFTIEGRPWALSRSISTEKLIVDLLAIVFRHGYIFLSTIDYGREQDDRLAMAFSKPAVYGTSRPTSPDPVNTHGSPIPPPRTLRLPFAISFSSATVLRVINPPLNSTPAILQAVRGSWPRGVVAEKKIADTCFEFKLKGYKWFQEDTFAQDSLQHILTLLAGLDTHGFKLLSSMTLTSRSRIKDLWIFTGPSNEVVLPDSPSASPRNSSQDPERVDAFDGVRGSLGYGGPRHVRNASAPSSSLGTSPSMGGLKHNHNTSETLVQSPASGTLTQSSSSRLLRKPAPKASVLSSSSGISRQTQPVIKEQFRASLPSEVGSGINMTGVGTPMHTHAPDVFGTPEPEVFYETHTEEQVRAPSPSVTQVMQDDDPFYRAIPENMPPPMPTTFVTADHNKGSQQAAPASTEVSQKVFSSRPIPVDQPRTPSPPHMTPHTSALLGPGAFRDTTFSASTGWRSTGMDVPVTWFGAGGLEARESQVGKHDSGVGLPVEERMSMRPPLTGRARSSSAGAVSPYADLATPRLPGAWAPTPETERQGNMTPTQQRVRTPRTSRTPPGPGPASSGYFHENNTRSRGTPDGQSPHWAFPAPHQLERLDVEARVSNPALISEGAGVVRKSEAGIVGVIPAGPPPALPPRKAEPDTKADTKVDPSRGISGDAWVMVDVGPKRPPNRPRSTSESDLYRGKQMLPPPTRKVVADQREASNTSLPVKEMGTMRRLFSINKEHSPSKFRKVK